MCMCDMRMRLLDIADEVELKLKALTPSTCSLVLVV